MYFGECFRLCFLFGNELISRIKVMMYLSMNYVQVELSESIFHCFVAKQKKYSPATLLFANNLSVVIFTCISAT